MRSRISVNGNLIFNSIALEHFTSFHFFYWQYDLKKCDMNKNAKEIWNAVVNVWKWTQRKIRMPIDDHPTIHAYEPFKRKTVKKYVQLRI